MALRPELTPSLARLVLQKGKALPLPAKWFAIGQCWRYERTTRGRRREHYQWNMDIVGMPGVEAEAELLAAITMFFSRVGLTSKDVGIKVSSRKVLQGLLQQCDVPEASFGPVCVIVDKAEKIPREEVVKQLGALGLPEATVDRILSVLEVGVMVALWRTHKWRAAVLCMLHAGRLQYPSCALHWWLLESRTMPCCWVPVLNQSSPAHLPACLPACAPQVKSLEQLEALLGPEAEAVEDLKRLFALAEGYGYADWLVLDASVVRGLAYYTGGWAGAAGVCGCRVVLVGAGLQRRGRLGCLGSRVAAQVLAAPLHRWAGLRCCAALRLDA